MHWKKNKVDKNIENSAIHSGLIYIPRAFWFLCSRMVKNVSLATLRYQIIRSVSTKFELKPFISKCTFWDSDQKCHANTELGACFYVLQTYWDLGGIFSLGEAPCSPTAVWFLLVFGLFACVLLIYSTASSTVDVKLPLPWSPLSWSPACWWSSWSPSTACSEAWSRLVGNAPRESAPRCPPPSFSCTGPPWASAAHEPEPAPPPGTSWSSEGRKMIQVQELHVCAWLCTLRVRFTVASVYFQGSS